MLLQSSRYQLTLLFSDLSNSTSISKVMEPEHFMEIMSQLRAIWKQVSDKNHGNLVRTQGDGALIIFGYPNSTEDDGFLAAEVALEIHEQVEKIYHKFLPNKFFPLKMHSGIHAGSVLLSQGDIEKGRFDITGDIPNVAAHLAAAAAPGQIITSMAVLGPKTNYFDIDKLSIKQLRINSPTDVCAIVRRNSISNRFDATKRRGLTPLVGRDGVKNQILNFLNSNSNNLLVLIGSAGFGKTRLINEIFSQKQTEYFYWGTCESKLTSQALSSFKNIFKEIYSSTKNFDATTLEDIVSYFSIFVKKNKITIVIDDWQWADDTSRQLVSMLLTISSGLKIILATRPQDEESIWVRNVVHINLMPLSEEHTSIAVKNWLPNADPFLCINIYLYSGGVPLFIEELCHSANVIDLKKTISELNANQSWIGTLVASRLSRLRVELQALIRVCSVIGNNVPISLLKIISTTYPDNEIILELEQADFLYPIYNGEQVESLLFKHGITRDIVYKGIGFTERSQIHQQLLNIFKSHQTFFNHENEVTEQLAFHSRGAGQWELAAQYAESSGDKSVKAFALDLANAQYKIALDALDRIPESNPEQSLTWCKISGKLALTSIFDPLCLGNDLSIYESAVRIAVELKDASAIAQAKYWLGYLQYGLGKFRSATVLVREALEIANEANLYQLSGPFKATLGQILVASSDYDEGLFLLTQALESKKLRTEQLKGSSAMGVAYSLAISGFAYADRGEFDTGHKLFTEALDLLDGTTHPIGNSVRNFICVSYVWQENWVEAEKIALESVKIAENRRTLLQLASSRGLLNYIHWATGQDRTGLERFKETLVWMDDHKSSFYTSLYFGLLAHACTIEGQIEEARQYAYRVHLRRKEGEILGEAMASRAMAKVAFDAGKATLAKRWLHKANLSAVARKSERELRLDKDIYAILNP